MAEFTIKQTGRLLTLQVEGKAEDSLIPLAFSGREALSELYAYSLDVVSDELELAANDILGRSVTVAVDVAERVRFFEGIVAGFSPGLLWGRGYRAYRLEVVPRLWLATLNARCRAFLNKSALDIVHDVLGEYGISETKRGVGGVERPVREYCLQYCESDFAFIARLLEEEGLFFYFPIDHDNRKLVLVDGSNGSFPVEEGGWVMTYDWSHDLHTVPQGVTYAGYDFKQASVVLGSRTAANRLAYAAQATVEVYPSNTIDTPRSSFFAQTHMQRLESDYETFTGKSAHPCMAPGGRLQLEESGLAANGRQVMVTAVEHNATCYSQVSSDADRPNYGNRFTALPLEATYRPPRRTARPLIQGPQTAAVTTDPDEYGRVKVKFHWGEPVESWWVRVAMPWASSQMGMQFLPRVGSEVVVEFLDGNPERPIIVGAVYNGKNKPTYPLPDKKTVSGIRGTPTDATAGSGTLNEIQFEDKGGEERLSVVAAKDFTRTVVNKDSLTVRQGDRTITLEQGSETHELKTGNLSTKLALGAATTEAMQSIELKVGANSLKIDQKGITLNGLTIKIEGNMMTSLKGAATTVEGIGMLTVKGGITMIN